METTKKFSCDVDGIFNNYPECWLEFLATRCGTKYSTVKDAKANESRYREYKDDYRNSSYKAHLPVNSHNRDIINKMGTKLDAMIVTSRPILDENYPMLYQNTINWLKDNDIAFTSFNYKDKDATFIDKLGGVLFHIDDDPAFANVVASKGVKVYLLKNNNWDFTCVDCSDNIIFINEIDEILAYESIF